MSDTVQLSDQYLLASSLKNDPEVHVSKRKHVVSVSDLQQGYTSGQVTIDGTNQLNGSQGFGSLSEAYLTVPYVVTAKNTGAQGFSAPLTRFACTLKTGVWNVISDLELSLNGKSIITSNDYKSFWNNLRAQTETSISDMYKHSAENFLQPDDWFSINWDNTASSAGDGYSNNQCDTTQFLDATLGQTQENRSTNSGFVARLNNTPAVVDTSTNKAWGWPTLGKSAIQQVVSQHGRGCFVEASTAGVGAIAGTWIYMLKIRLVDLHPIFKELDLIANPQIKLKYRVNCGTVAIDMQRTDAQPTITFGGTPASGLNTLQGLSLADKANNMSLNSVTMTSGTVCPIMVASGANGQPMSSVSSTVASQISFSFGVLRNAFSPDTAALSQYLPYTTTRLQIPFYDITDPRPIISKPIKTVRFLDCFAQYFKGKGGSGIIDGQQNASFNFQMSATLKNVKYVALIPFADTGLGHWKSTTLNAEQFQSPFDSAPWTCQPGASVRNFQVQLGNTNVFAKTHEYDYETFLHEFSKLGAINGDLERSLNCGLVDMDRWTYAHRVMVADCSRIGEKDVPVSIQISGTNACSQASNYLALIAYEREMTYDRLTGEVVDYSS